MFEAGAWLARWIPLRMTRAIAGFFGALYALTHPGRVAVVQGNLRLLNAVLDQKAARKVYAEFGSTLADYFYIGTRPSARAAQIITRIDGQEHLQEAHRRGKGALIVTAHFGLFELGGLLMAESGLPFAVLTLPEPSKALSDWRAQFRHRWKADTIEIGNDSFAFLQIADRLRQGTFIATLIDRPHPTESTPVNLPNGVAYFSAGMLLLAAHCQVPVIPATMVRCHDGSYHAHIFAPIFVQERASRAETLRFYSQQIVDTFLPVLAAYPEQWYQFVPLSHS